METPPDNFDYPGNVYPGWWPIGSLFVMPGCTLYLWKENDYEGERSLKLIAIIHKQIKYIVLRWMGLCRYLIMIGVYPTELPMEKYQEV